MLSTAAVCYGQGVRIRRPSKAWHAASTLLLSNSRNGGESPMTETVPLLSAVNLHKTYHKHAVDVPVLQGVNLDVAKGEFISVVGVSGSGKSTLLHLLGTLDRPDEGSILLEGDR